MALGAAGSSLQLLGNYVEGPGWLDERRPDALEWADTAVNDTMLLNESPPPPFPALTGQVSSLPSY